MPDELIGFPPHLVLRVNRMEHCLEYCYETRCSQRQVLTSLCSVAILLRSIVVVNGVAKENRKPGLFFVHAPPTDLRDCLFFLVELNGALGIVVRKLNAHSYLSRVDSNRSRQKLHGSIHDPYPKQSWAVFPKETRSNEYVL